MNTQIERDNAALLTVRELIANGYDSNADALEVVCEAVDSTGRPPCGDEFVCGDKYMDALGKWASAPGNTAGDSPEVLNTWRTLNEIAAALGSSDEWSSDEMHEVEFAVLCWCKAAIEGSRQ